jgi:hypothetical protein
VVHRGKQVHLRAIAAAGAPQRLAVDRDRPTTLLLGGAVAVDEPRADHRRQRRWVHALEGPADGGLGRYHPPVGGVTASAERGTHRLRGIRGPRGDRSYPSSAG